MSSACGDEISRLKLDEECHEVLRDYHAEARESAAKARDRLEALGMGFAVPTAGVSCGGPTVAAGQEVSSTSGKGEGSSSRDLGTVVEGSLCAGDDESEWGVIIYATALVKGCKNIEESLDALFDAYGSPLKLDEVAKTLLKAGMSKAGGGVLSERIKSVRSTIYALATQKAHLQCAGGMIERVEVKDEEADVGSTAGGGLALQTA